MKTTDRKASIAAYKERKRHAGVFAIRCAARGEIWVGSAPDLDTIQNRIWFTLKHGGNSNAALKAAYAAHGQAGLQFDILEAIKEEEDAYIRGKMLLARASHWRETLAAQAV
jgi:hypothetical protein